MSLAKLALELEETAHRSAEMVAGVYEALEALGDRQIDLDQARVDAINQIIVAAQAQDRIEQRLKALAQVVRGMRAKTRENEEISHSAIWSELVLDELRLAELSERDRLVSDGDAELF